jgi:hypothetical protein
MCKFVPVPKPQTTKSYKVEVKLSAFLTFTLDRSELSASRSRRFNPGNNSWQPVVVLEKVNEHRQADRNQSLYYTNRISEYKTLNFNA